MRPTYGLVPTSGVISIEAEKDIIGEDIQYKNFPNSADLHGRPHDAFCL